MFATRGLLSRPLYLLLLPLFALWHAGNALFGFITAGLALHFLLLAGTVLLLAWVVAALLLRNRGKASGVAFVTGFVFIYYGVLQDKLEPLLPATARSYTWLPLLLFGMAAVAAFFLFSTERRRSLLTRYLNLLFLVFCLVEAGTSLVRAAEYRRHGNGLFTQYPLSEQYRTPLPGSARPDIFLLVMDEYAGAGTLAQMGHDNRPFLDSLRRLGLWVAPQSRSNYDFTLFSMSSLLQMRYLDSNLEHRQDDPRTVLRAVRSLSDNETLRMLERSGYEIRFEAPFDSDRKNRDGLNEFGDFAWTQLFGATLTGRLRRDRARTLDPWAALFAPVYGYNDAARRRQDLAYYRAALLSSIDSNAARKPRFVYQHLLLTHHPYLFDSTGGPRERMASAAEEPAAYLDQVRLATRILLEQVARIRREGRRNTVILLLSDHGYREGGARYDSLDNLFALYFPRGDYGDAAAASPVNAFRVVFNRYFGQQWPLLPYRGIRSSGKAPSH
ncbi:hypothetical protein [Flaviaesturariibacter aridisoli]|uniref:Sulfatase N-terminal domain-containing protein n=1 Tax=Flaviaesturariibacter aridisoli TaxID=2545761 RepID=A0A4R4E446_9BACT|nr:hypothetical protein [Flaviaesturariibacter aridisoli]TCZ71405.1 hypothetical protein E0486_10010 [Flaviaesturariibacter aridisoli]